MLVTGNGLSKSRVAWVTREKGEEVRTASFGHAYGRVLTQSKPAWDIGASADIIRLI